MHDHAAGDPTASFASPMAEVLTTLQLFGHLPNADDLDRRPLPALEALEAIVPGLFVVLPEGLAENRREDDLPDSLWAPVNLFTAGSNASNATSTTTSRLNDAAKPSRTFQKCARSNSSGSLITASP